jgi:uncharacterized protein YceH (UPF0502 family)
MALTTEEARVLGSLIEKEATVPDSYPLSLNALRLACNQSTNRSPIVAYDDRTVENVLLSLKSMGLVRFVHPSHGGRRTRYRHSADERWRLSGPELAVLSVLILRGPQTVSEVRSRAERHHPFGDMYEVEAILDTLAGRSPEPFAVRLERRSGERDARWAQVLTGEPNLDDFPPEPMTEPGARTRARRSDVEEVTAGLAEELAELRRRVDRLERLVDRSDAAG